MKRALKEARIKQIDAAPQLGVTFEHLNRVLNGHRVSASLLERVQTLISKSK